MRRAVLAASGAVITGCVAYWARTGDQTGRIATHLAVYGIAFAAYLAALGAVEGLSRAGLGVALGVSVIWRLTLAAAPPLVSNDVNRSVWEGRIQLHGGNPYAWPDRPDSPRWTSLRDDVFRDLNHPEYTAIYPPAWQLAARGVVAVSDSVAAMKGFVALCEMAVLVPLAFLLKKRHLPRERLLILAWSPLALVETAGGGHNEAFGILFLVLALAALESGRPALSALAAAVGFQAKFLPGLIAAAWARRYRPWHALCGAAFAAALLWPYRSAGRTLWLSLSKYSEFWLFNETLFAPLSALIGDHVAAVRAGSALAAALAFALAWRRVEPVAAAQAVVAAVLLLSPNVLPWYGLWFLPLLVLRDEPAALLFTGTASLAYLVYPAWQSGERWSVGWGVRALEYLPCALVALVALYKTQSPGRSGAEPAVQ